MTTPAPPPLSPDQARARGRARTGATWFYLIAALSVINSLVARYGGGVSFIFGLGTTRILDQLAGAWLGSYAGLSLILTVGVALIFALIGLAAHRGFAAAYGVGLLLYAADAVVFVVVPAKPQWLPVAFHVYAAYRIVSGFLALRQVQALAYQVDPYHRAVEEVNAQRGSPAPEAAAPPELPQP